MTHVVLSIGSNVAREANIRFAIIELKKRYGAIQISPVYDSATVGFDGPRFLNVVVGLWVEASCSEIHDALLAIERQAGRVRARKSYNNRTLDIDVLLFGDADLRHQQINIPRDEIEHHAFVLKPLSDLYPDLHHPISGLSYRQMRMRLGDMGQQLTRIEFDFQ